MAKRREKRRQPAEEQSGRGQQGVRRAKIDPAAAAQRIQQWADEAAQAHGAALYDVELVVHGRWIIRVFIDLPGPLRRDTSVSADQCADVSRYLEAYLDAAEDFPQNYVLEVSSPGIERELKTPAHLEHVVGHRVRLIVRQQVNGQNKVVGELVGYQQDVLRVLLDGHPDEPVDIRWADVKEARLQYDFDF